MADHAAPARAAAPAEGAAARVRLRRWARSAGRALISRRLGVALSIIAVAVVGVVLGVLLGGRTSANVGPFQAELRLTPGLFGDTEVDVPPLGALHLDSHDGPAHLTVRLGSLDQGRTEALIDDPSRIPQASRGAVGDVTSSLIQVGLRSAGAAVLAALALAALVFRNARRVAWAGITALAVAVGSLGIAGLTFRPDSIQKPRYEGLLVNAPAVVGDARRIATRYDEYAQQLQKLVSNVSRLYLTISTLPVFEPEQGTTRVLHVSDLHLNPTAWSVIRTVVERFEIDVVIDTGDITDWGSEPEASYVGTIPLLRVPYVFIRGNHDSAATAAAIAERPNAIVLENSIRTVAGLTIAGIGDPRFTPDKETSPTGSGSSRQTIDRVSAAGAQLAETIAKSPPVDIALVHDPASAGALSGTCPLVLAGHRHERSVSMLTPASNGVPTRLLVEGSTGGAGLRGLEQEEPHPLELSVLYFDNAQQLLAYDDITVGGAGLAHVSLERHPVDDTAPAPLPQATTQSGPEPGN